MEINTKEAIKIGDRGLDIMAGKNAGISSCYFNPDKTFDVEADYYISSNKQLRDIMLSYH